MTNFQDLVAKVKNLVALAPVLGAISRPADQYNVLPADFKHFFTKITTVCQQTRYTKLQLRFQETYYSVAFTVYFLKR